jgi:hypothetical protein
LYKLRNNVPEIGIALNALVLLIGYYYLGLIKAEIPTIVSAPREASLEFWGSMLYIFLVLLLTALIIQLILYGGKFLAVKLGFEEQ